MPATLIAFAGLTKAAQLPFSSWLLGAMVAPTPVSALLHSSTMVKAGVYAIVKFAPVLANTLPGLVLGLVGGVTFLAASAIAVTQSNAKRVLAYSTVANLGLVVACGGIGTYRGGLGRDPADHLPRGREVPPLPRASARSSTRSTRGTSRTWPG